MLTDVKVRNAEPRDKDYKLFDQRGLYVLVTRKGFKSWRFKYRFGGKYGGLVLGTYPGMTLRAARDAADELFRQCRDGKDPALGHRRRKLVGTSLESTFESFAMRWHEREKPHWRPVHANDVLTSLKRDILPDLGAFPVDQIDRQLMLAVLKKVETRGAIETAHRLRQRCEAIFDLAITVGATNANPAAGLTRAMSRKPVKRRWPAILDIAALRQLLQDVDTAGASPTTRAASRILALTAQRPGMVRRMRWSQVTGIDWSDPNTPAPDAVWTIPAEEMKLVAEQRSDEFFDHAVPLARQAVELLRAMRNMTGAGDYIFWSNRSSREPISENALPFLYKRLGYQGRHVPHGWRGSFSTIMNEIYADEPSLGISWKRIIDLMLAHIQTGVSASELRYNQAKYAVRRREVAERWANHLMKDAVGVDRVVTGPRRPLSR